MKMIAQSSKAAERELKRRQLKRGLRKNASLYLLVAPVIVWFIIFCYVPMFGAVMAFQNFRPASGFFGSEWVGLQHFKDFFGSYYFGRLLKNTLTLSISYMVVMFPLEIVLALLLNEVRNLKFKKLVQTVTYMPHFVSLVVICGMVINFVSEKGIINDVIAFFGGERGNLLAKPEAFPAIYVISGVWQQLGWNSIIYIAAIAGVDQELYEAAAIDGAGRLRAAFSVTLPCIMPTIVMMFILSLGGIINVGYEKIILLYNAGIYRTADVISTYVYRKGLEDMQYSYSAAVGLFNSVVTVLMVTAANKIVNKLDDSMGLW